MSEELLKALMQLYAIVVKQNNGPSQKESDFVHNFLSTQIVNDKVEQYFNLFKEFSIKKSNEKRISVSDSVSIIGIAKDINKILTQKQKIFVLIKIFELIKADSLDSTIKIEITKTIADVFNISNQDFKLLEIFVFQNYTEIVCPELLIVGIDKQLIKQPNENTFINSINNYDHISVLKISSINLYLYKINGSIDAKWNGSKIQNNVIYIFANAGIIQFNNGKSIYYQEIVSFFSPESSFTPLSFNVNSLSHKFLNGKPGLHEINISEGPGKLVAIMGASGSGKTTLLNIISGLQKPTSGKILLNGIDVHSDLDKIKGAIGFVPQDDLLIEELTVFENLYFNAKFCFANLSDKEIKTKVLNLLEILGLSEIADLKVGNVLNKIISGGQRKRLNIALELIREPTVLFLDEPTSGLSSRDSENIVKLLSELTSKGNLIFVVIHQPGSDIYKLFDKIILLDKGGYLVYYGNPVEAISYFKKIDNWINNEQGECFYCGNINMESIFNIIEAETIDEYGNYTGIRKVAPQKWNNFYKNNFTLNKKNDISSNPFNLLKTPSRLYQLIIYFKRDFFSKAGNLQYLLLNALEIPLLAFILSFIVRYTVDENNEGYIYRKNDNIPAYIFMSVIVFSFMGISLSGEEIFKDRKILKREKFLNLSWFSYLSSKIFILFFISALQSLLFVLIGNSIVEIKGMFFNYWIVLFTISCCANLIGLNISSAFNSAITIYILIPLLLIPQMILGGAMFSYEKLNSCIGGGYQVPMVANLMPARWAYEALMVSQFKDNEFEKKFYEFEKKESVCNYKRGAFASYLTKTLSEIEKELERGEVNVRNEEIFKRKVNLLNNEICNELNQNKLIKLSVANNITSDKINKVIIDSAQKYIERLTNFYASILNNVITQKEMLLFKKQNTDEKKEAFLNFKNAYYNDYLSDVVKNTYSIKKNSTVDNKLIQIIDPVFNEPEIGSNNHFYAPKKIFLNKKYDTFYYNISVLWIFNIIFFAALYFNLLKKIISLNINLNKN